MLKLNVGASRKVADNNYGSRGASINLEIELDSGLVTDSAKLQERIRQLFGIVRTSLAEELNGNGNGHTPKSDDANGQAKPPASANGNGSRSNGNQRRATQSQVKAINSIARNRRIDIAQFLHQRFHVGKPEELTLKEASQVIDELKGDSKTEGRPS